MLILPSLREGFLLLIADLDDVFTESLTSRPRYLHVFLLQVARRHPSLFGRGSFCGFCADQPLFCVVHVHHLNELAFRKFEAGSGAIWWVIIRNGYVEGEVLSNKNRKGQLKQAVNSLEFSYHYYL